MFPFEMSFCKVGCKAGKGIQTLSHQPRKSTCKARGTIVCVERHSSAWHSAAALPVRLLGSSTNERRAKMSTTRAGQASVPNTSQFNIDRTYPGRWTITFSNPPINMFVPTTIVELGAIMTGLEADPSVKVVVFESANPDFFIAHLDVAKTAERPEVL